ncbi:Glutathione S-transferase C-terminal domain containing protein [Cryptosporidium felis]|nr:Glutathione S-transferase C-terminal domain containing protein [Cryptosporidium felis]
MNCSKILASVFLLITFFSVIESKSTFKPITLYTTKELDASHLIRNILVVSSIPFTEMRFKKNSESQREIFSEIIKNGYLSPSLPMISDVSKNVRNISTSEAVMSYLVFSYNRELISKNLLEYTLSIQLTSIVNTFIKKTVKILESSKSLVCSKVLQINNIAATLKALSKAYEQSKNNFFYGDKITLFDLTAYTLILFIENVYTGCAVYNFKPLRKFAVFFSSIPQIHAFENSSYFLSLLIPGTDSFAKRINFAQSTKEFSFLTD